MVPREAVEVIAQPVSEAFLGFFYGMLIASGVGLLVILITVLRAKLYRCLTWYGFCIAWIIFCVSYLLLISRTPGTEVPFGLCFAQAVLVYACPVLTAYATLALVVQLTTLFTSGARKTRCDLPPRYWVPLLVAPYAIFIAVLTMALVIGLRNRDLVKRKDIYCVVSSRIPSLVVAVLIVLAMLAVLGFVVFNGICAWRHWRVLCRLDHSARLPIFLLVRLGIFILFSAVSVGVSVAFAARTNPLVPRILLVLLPFFACVVFGTQTDILHTWMFWRRDLPPTPVQHVTQDGSFDLDSDSPTLDSPATKSFHLEIA